jgi:hypothetical protein
METVVAPLLSFNVTMGMDCLDLCIGIVEKLESGEECSLPAMQLAI